MTKILSADEILKHASPVLNQQGHETQPYGHHIRLPIALDEAACKQSAISRLLHAHEIVLKEARTMARLAAKNEDDGTNDLLVSDVIRTNELQVWFVAEHVVDTPLVRVDE